MLGIVMFINGLQGVLVVLLQGLLLLGVALFELLMGRLPGSFQDVQAFGKPVLALGKGPVPLQTTLLGVAQQVPKLIDDRSRHDTSVSEHSNRSDGENGVTNLARGSRGRRRG